LAAARSGVSSLPAASVTGSKRSILAYGAVCGESKRLRKNALRDYTTNALHMTNGEVIDALLTDTTTTSSTATVTTKFAPIAAELAERQLTELRKNYKQIPSKYA
jgi:hypothetical protein